MLTDQQKTKYNTYREAGLEPNAALALVKKNNPATPNKGIDHVLFGGKGSFASSVGQGVKDATVGVVEDFVDQKNQYSLGEALVRTPLTALAGVGEGVGTILGSAAETADDIFLGGELGETLSPKVEEFMQSNTGQAIAGGIEYIDEKTHGISGDILDSLNLLGVAGFVKSGAATTVKEGFKNSTKSILGKTDDLIKTGKKKVTGSLLDDFDDLNFSNVDEAMKSPKSGITAETSGIKTKFAPEKISVPDKEFLIEVDKAIGKRYLEAFKASEQSHKVDNIFTVAIKDTKKALDDYVTKTKEVGSEIGKIKEKMEATPVDGAKVDDILGGLQNDLSKKGLEFVDGQFQQVAGRTSTFNKTDINLLNDLVKNLDNVKGNPTGLEINNAIEVLDNLKGLQNTTKTNAIDRLAIQVRKQLDDVRKAGLDDAEKAAFTEYSNTIEFVNDFQKGNLENKIAALLNKSGSKYENRLTEISNEITRVTGTNVEQYAMLTKILSKASRDGSRNASTLKQYFDSASLSPAATADGLVGKGLEKLFDTDMLEEMEKAINTTISTP